MLAFSFRPNLYDTDMYYIIARLLSLLNFKKLAYFICMYVSLRGKWRRGFKPHHLNVRLRLTGYSSLVALLLHTIDFTAMYISIFSPQNL